VVDVIVAAGGTPGMLAAKTPRVEDEKAKFLFFLNDPYPQDEILLRSYQRRLHRGGEDQASLERNSRAHPPAPTHSPRRRQVAALRHQGQDLF